MVTKWSGHRKKKKGTFTTEVAGKQKKNVFKFKKKNIQKYVSTEVVQLYKTSGKMAKCYLFVHYFQFFNNFEDIFAVLQLAFSMLNSSV